MIFLISSTGNQVAHRKMEKTVQSIVSDLQRHHGSHILSDPEWVTFAQGGAVGTMKILYLSPTESISVIGMPISMEGHTGEVLIIIFTVCNMQFATGI